MRPSHKPVWTEGMFLRPQHFQQFEHYAEQLLQRRVDSVAPWSWGWRRLTLDPSLLALGKVALVECDGVFADGFPVRIPLDAPSPAVLEPPPGVADVIIYLCMPAPSPEGFDHSASEPSQAQSRYRCAPHELRDVTRPAAPPARIALAAPQLSLRMEAEVGSGWSRLAVGRIADRAQDGAITLDESFIPPVLSVGGSTPLSRMLNNLRAMVNARAEALTSRLVEAADPAEWPAIDLLTLQTLRRAQRLLDHLATMQHLHPERLYAELAALTGALEAFLPSSARAPSFPPYLHDDPRACFAPVAAALAQALRAASEPGARRIPLQKQPYGAWMGEAHDATLYASARFILVLRSPLATEPAGDLLPGLIKVGPARQLSQLVGAQTSGARVKRLPAPPRGITPHGDAIYLELEAGPALRRDISASGGIGIHLSGPFTDVTMEMWALASQQASSAAAG